VIFNISSHLLS